MWLKDLLLNFFLILTPLYFYPFISNRFSQQRRGIYLGVICGIAAMACMKVPVVAGEGFIWDFRWIALLIAILYGGQLSAGIAGTILVLFRFSLGGLLSSITALCCALLLILLFLPKAKRFIQESTARKVFLCFQYSSFTVFVLIIVIAFQFWFSGQVVELTAPTMLVIVLMALSYIAALCLFCYFVENIMGYMRQKDAFHEAEKNSILHEISSLLAYDVKSSIHGVKDSFRHFNQNTLPLNAAFNELEKLEGMVDKYVSYTKNEKRELEPIKMDVLLNDLVKLLSPYSKFKEVPLIVDARPDLVMRGDPLKIKQILLNLIKNSMDAVPRYGSVLIAAAENEKDVIISITDEGIGMSEEQLNEIKYYLRHLNGKTIGRGLFVALKLIESIDGKILFESSVGKGTVVHIMLPKDSNSTLFRKLNWSFKKGAVVNS
ncbi:ATP-binding protein [Falsibacillus pallidus]|uniref:ATP-binding protein n=1 Tax=Falsibacillus pallidus TaxID=493781 RepID=UPI003D9728CC